VRALTITFEAQFNPQLDTPAAAQHDVHVSKQEESLRDIKSRRAPRTSRANRPARAAAQPEQGPENLTYLRIVDQVTRTGISQRELGEAVGASVRTVQNWASGQAAPRGNSRERLLDVQYVVEELRDVYTDEGIQIWLRARNRNFGGQRPIDLITAGDIDTVLQEAQRLAGAM
jgi:DNA-binding transcriptional regulator YiaG